MHRRTENHRTPQFRQSHDQLPMENAGDRRERGVRKRRRPTSNRGGKGSAPTTIRSLPRPAVRRPVPSRRRRNCAACASVCVCAVFNSWDSETRKNRFAFECTVAGTGATATDAVAQRPRAQRPSGPAAQRPSGTAAQRHSGTAARFQHAVVQFVRGTARTN